MRSFLGRPGLVGVMLGVVAAAGLGVAPQAAANTSYISNKCYAASDYDCLRIYYTRGNFGLGEGACFLTNRSLGSHWGYTDGPAPEVAGQEPDTSAASTVRYIFRQRMSCGSDPRGHGQGIVDNANTVANGDYYAHRIYEHSGYYGKSHYISSAPGYVVLNDDVRNDNGSSRRL